MTNELDIETSLLRAPHVPQSKRRYAPRKQWLDLTNSTLSFGRPASTKRVAMVRWLAGNRAPKIRRNASSRRVSAVEMSLRASNCFTLVAPERFTHSQKSSNMTALEHVNQKHARPRSAVARAPTKAPRGHHWVGGTWQPRTTATEEARAPRESRCGVPWPCGYLLRCRPTPRVSPPGRSRLPASRCSRSARCSG